MSQPDESVLVVRRSLFDELGSFHGLNFEPESPRALLSRGNNFFLRVPRRKMIPPINRSFLTIIAHDDTVLHYVRGEGRRTAVGREGSIGIGGHMNQEDESLSISPSTKRPIGPGSSAR